MSQQAEDFEQKAMDSNFHIINREKHYGKRRSRQTNKLHKRTYKDYFLFLKGHTGHRKSPGSASPHAYRN